MPYKRRSFADKVNMQIQAAEQEKQARESGSRSTRVSTDQEVVVAQDDDELHGAHTASSVEASLSGGNAKAQGGTPAKAAPTGTSKPKKRTASKLITEEERLHAREQLEQLGLTSNNFQVYRMNADLFFSYKAWCLT